MSQDNGVAADPSVAQCQAGGDKQKPFKRQKRKRVELGLILSNLLLKKQQRVVFNCDVQTVFYRWWAQNVMLARDICPTSVSLLRTTERRRLPLYGKAAGASHQSGAGRVGSGPIKNRKGYNKDEDVRLHRRTLPPQRCPTCRMGYAETFAQHCESRPSLLRYERSKWFCDPVS